MLKEAIQVVELIELEPSSVAEYCEMMLNAERLRDDLLGDGPFGRKSICDFLGINESTLTRWFQTGRVPPHLPDALTAKWPAETFGYLG